MSEEPHVVETIEIQGIYDGVSVYVMSDGTYVNRWTETLAEWPDEPDDETLRYRQRRTDDFIAMLRATRSGEAPRL